MAEAEKPTTASHASRVVIRPHSDILYLFPTLFAAIIAGLVVTFVDNDPVKPGLTGLLFLLFFFFNLTIVAFNYTRLTSVVIVLLFVIFGLLSALYPAIGVALQDLMKQPLFMNATFYWVWSIGMALVLLGVFIKARLDYYELKNNELIHRRGLLGDIERWPASNMRVSKEIKDVMEYFLARSGRLVLIPPGETRAIVIDNVIRINHIETEMQRMLSTLHVDTEH
jgi:hypothetical protein